MLPSSAPNGLGSCEGVLPLMVAFLDQGVEEGCNAMDILVLLCSPHIDPQAQHAALLARFQGVRRLSNIFSTVQKTRRTAAGMCNHVSLMLRKACQHVLMHVHPSLSVDAVGLSHPVFFCHLQVRAQLRVPAVVPSVNSGQIMLLS